MARVMAVRVPDDLHQWVLRYDGVGHREGFIWRWVMRGLAITTLSSVDADLRADVQIAKALGVMLDVLLDDIADVQQDPDLLERALVVLTKPTTSLADLEPEQARYVGFISDVWEEIQRRARQLPRYEELADVLRYDYAQLFNTMRYALLVNRHPHALNVIENCAYQVHNMHMMISATVDLMASSGFDAAELGLLREIAWRAQRMGRIGNQVSTWRRELNDRDFTSEVFAYALHHGLIDLAQLTAGETEEVADRLAAADVETHFLDEWQTNYDEILAMAPRLESVDAVELLDGLEELIKIHLGSVGRK